MDDQVARHLAELRSPKVETRLGAVQAIGQLGAPAAVRPLVELVRDGDSDWAVRGEASFQLIQIGQPAAAAVLDEVNSTANPMPIRAVFATMLDDMGIDTQEQVEPNAELNYLKGVFRWEGAKAIGGAKGKRLPTGETVEDAQRRRWRLAIADFSRALAVDPEFAHAYMDRGVVYTVVGDLDKALADQSTAINLEPRNPQPHYLRGLVHALLSDFDSACSDLITAEELDPQGEWGQRARDKLREFRLRTRSSASGRLSGVSEVDAYRRDNPGCPLSVLGVLTLLILGLVIVGGVYLVRLLTGAGH